MAESDESNNVRAAAIQIGTVTPPPSTIAFVGTVGTKTANGNASKVALTIPSAGVGAGHSIVVALQAGTNATLAGVNCSDPVNGNYSRDAGAGGGDRPLVAVLSRHNVAALPSGQTITCTFPKQRAGASMIVNEFSGLPASALDRTAAATGTASGLQSSGLTATTTQANELVFGLSYAPGGFTPATSNSVEGVYSPAYSAAGVISGIRPFFRVPAVPALRQYELNGVPGSGAWTLVVVTYRGN